MWERHCYDERYGGAGGGGGSAGPAAAAAGVAAPASAAAASAADVLDKAHKVITGFGALEKKIFGTDFGIMLYRRKKIVTVFERPRFSNDFEKAKICEVFEGEKASHFIVFYPGHDSFREMSKYFYLDIKVCELSPEVQNWFMTYAKALVDYYRNIEKNLLALQKLLVDLHVSPNEAGAIWCNKAYHTLNRYKAVEYKDFLKIQMLPEDNREEAMRRAMELSYNYQRSFDKYCRSIGAITAPPTERQLDNLEKYVRNGYERLTARELIGFMHLFCVGMRDVVQSANKMVEYFDCINTSRRVNQAQMYRLLGYPISVNSYQWSFTGNCCRRLRELAKCFMPKADESRAVEHVEDVLAKPKFRQQLISFLTSISNDVHSFAKPLYENFEKHKIALSLGTKNYFSDFYSPPAPREAQSPVPREPIFFKLIVDLCSVLQKFGEEEMLARGVAAAAADLQADSPETKKLKIESLLLQIILMLEPFCRDAKNLEISIINSGANKDGVKIVPENSDCFPDQVSFLSRVGLPPGVAVVPALAAAGILAADPHSSSAPQGEALPQDGRVARAAGAELAAATPAAGQHSLDTAGVVSEGVTSAAEAEQAALAAAAASAADPHALDTSADAVLPEGLPPGAASAAGAAGAASTTGVKNQAEAMLGEGEAALVSRSRSSLQASALMAAPVLAPEESEVPEGEVAEPRKASATVVLNSR